ncbi:RagB/SusD family nutrient uptake outer membrane protein [Aestuariibaculum lutulentum]|uniref:RagB/SusD family nutrient uptake outer membrane protein n=1 Tax=Aestuariibaculum lutulentum TaxID=2920935 RepID=A0ABS9RHQ6_9FLAO|nr:RagB/SusD family nutrient uptake outer membrane protein [Aestuariibaculum lutulentum]MCH4551734.1 RagB/SusD family nutrient uptake outer membrane protein [Aestuariibaculum lutulentum]
MKKYILLSLLSVLVFSACESELDQAPLSNRSAADFYENETDFEQAIVGVYNAIKYHSSAQFYLSEVRSDNVYIAGLAGVRDWIPVTNFSRTLVTNPIVRDAWNDPYVGILRANTVLGQLNDNVVPDQTTRERMEGEVKFLRAFFYFDLVRFFGGVPLIDKIITPSEALEISRATPQEVYDLIVADLESAISLLPTTPPQAGRPSSVVAKALLGKVYLTMSGPTYSIEGPGLGVDMTSQALTLFNDVISSGQFGDVTDYATIFNTTSENNKDIVFAIQNINDGVGGDRGIGTILPTLMYHEAWARVHLPFAGGSPSDGIVTPSNELLNAYESADVRDDYSILRSWVDDTGGLSNDAMIVKYLDLDADDEPISSLLPVDRFNWGVDFPVIRYTDVLMMKAEILLKSGPSQQVDDIVNDVRARAGLGTVSNVDLDDLLEERRKEFFGEGLRFHDLVRTGKVIDIINAWEDVDDTAGVMNPMEANFIIYPINQSQLEVKPGLYEQNPGYN